MGNAFEIITLAAEASATASYDNHPIANVNDHLIRVSTMTQPYHWHCHPDSDETFLALDGGLLIDFEERSVQLEPGQMITVPRGIPHRTRPVGARSVNLTFERAGASTQALSDSSVSSTPVEPAR